MRGAAGGWETWSWDESLFAGAAGYYERGRLPYAPGLADVFARSLALDGRGRLLDVGCGPGTVTLRLAPLFDAAVGLDPDPGMLAYASRAAALQGAGNVTWVRQRAEALPGCRLQFTGPVAGRVYLHRRPARVKHRRDRPGDPGPVHPVERRGERHGSEAAQAGRQALGPLTYPGDVAGPWTAAARDA